MPECVCNVKIREFLEVDEKKYKIMSKKVIFENLICGHQ